MAKFIKTPVKGMCDMLPSDMRLRERVLSKIKAAYGAYGFMQIETPAMEHIENLTGKQGGDNEKLIFKVMKRGAELSRALEGGGELADSGLRYDLTVPLARYYAMNREKLPVPFKALQMGNVYRADNPQKGRFRQFTQCDIDILGDESNLAEIELIAATSRMISEIFADIGLREFTVHVNDRRILAAAALSAGFAQEQIGSALITLDKADKIGMDGVRAELIANGFDEDAVARYLALYADAGDDLSAFCERLMQGGFLDARVEENLAEILACAGTMLPEGARLRFSPTLVRGMGYYTGPIFEATLGGYDFAIAGGGRYDEMIGKFSGQRVPASGFSIGFERIVTVLKDHMDGPAKLAGATAFLVSPRAPQESRLRALGEATALREAGRIVTVLPMAKNVGHQIELLENEGFDRFEKIFE